MDIIQTEIGQEPYKLLYTFLNYLSLGQWQLAKICARQLSVSIDDGCLVLEDCKSIDMCNLLKAIIMHPHAIWCYSPSMPSPYHLSWLCIVEYNNLFQETEMELPRTVQLLVEFHLLLFTIQNELNIVNQNCHEELLKYFNTHLKNLDNNHQHWIPDLSQECIYFLSNLLITHRPIGDALIKQLLTPDISSNHINSIKLLHIYVNFISDQLNSLKECRPGQKDTILNNIYNILGVFDPPPNLISELKVGDLFYKLINSEQYGVNRMLIYNCINGRNNPVLLHTFTEIECLIFEKQFSSDNILFNNNNNNNDNINNNNDINNNNNDNGDVKWNYIFLHSFYHKNHILEDILDKGIQLVRDNDFERLSSLMCDSDWRPLKSLLLLLAWDHCKNMESAKKLLAVLYCPEDQTRQPALFTAIQKLYYQVNLVDWCIEKVRPLLEKNDLSNSLKETFEHEGDILTRLESQSILYMLHQSNSLSNTNPTDIMELLKMSPSTQDIPCSQTMLQESSQARDIAIYRSYLSIRLVLDAIICSTQIQTLIRDMQRGNNIIFEMLTTTKTNTTTINNNDSNIGASVDFQNSFQFDSSFDVASSSSGNQYQSAMPNNTKFLLAIDRYIRHILDDVKKYLQTIYPLAYRLEIIENIFSLIFLKYEDVIIDADNDSNESTTNFNIGSLLSNYLYMSIARNGGKTYQQPEFESASTAKSPLRAPSSTASQSSTDANRCEFSINCGFVMNRPMIEKLIQLVKDALNDIQTYRFAVKKDLSNETQDIVFDRNSTVSSSITSDTFETRFSALEKCINEANWRFKLVTNTEQYNKNKNNNNNDNNNIYMSSITSEDSSLMSPRKEEQLIASKWEHELIDDSLSDSLDGSSDDNYNNVIDSPTANNTQTKRQLSLSDKNKSSGDSITKSSLAESKRNVPKIPEKSHLDSGEEGDTEEKESSYTPKRKLKTLTSQISKRSIRKNLKSILIQNRNNEHNIVVKMLSTPENLLYMCLKLGNYTSAYEVVKIFKLENNSASQMVQFAEKIESIANELSTYPKSIEETSFHSITELMSKDNMNFVAFDKLSSNLHKHSKAMDELLKILVSTNLPKLLFSNDEKLLARVTESLILKQLVTFVPTLIILDLLCTYDIHYETSRELLKNATQKLTLHYSNISGSQNLTHIRRDSLSNLNKPLAIKAFDKQFVFENYCFSQPLKYLQIINEIIKISSEMPLPINLVYNGDKLKQLTPHSLLTLYIDPLKPNQFISMKKLREYQYRAVERLDRAVTNTIAIEKVGHVNEMTKDNILNSLKDLFKAFSTNREGILFPALDITQSDVSGDVCIPEELLSTGIISENDKEDSLQLEEQFEFLTKSNIKYTYNYFDWFFQHLEIIQTFLIKHQLQEDKSTALSSMNLLNESPSHILARLLFDRLMMPKDLEELASSVKLNVNQIIIRSTCPPLLHHTQTFNGYPLFGDDIYVLNKFEETDFICHQNNSANSLISFSIDLLKLALEIIDAHKLISDKFVNYLQLAKCITNRNFENFKHQIDLLSKCDLTLLKTDIEKICFYTNVLNSLHIYSAIIQSEGMVNNSQDNSIFGVCKIFSYLLNASYYIGQIGLVNLIDLQFKLLKIHKLDETFIASRGFRSLAYVARKKDRFTAHAIDQPEPRLIFVIGNAFFGNLRPKILTSEHYEDELRNAAISFCENNINYKDPTARQDLWTFEIPQFLFWFQQNFVSIDVPLEQKREILIKKLTPYLPQKIISLQQQQQLNIHVEICSHFWKFGFYTCNESNLLDIPENAFSNSNYSNYFDAKAHPNTQIDFKISDICLDYIINNNKIIGTLAKLVSLPEYSNIQKTASDSYSEEEKQQSIRSQNSNSSSEQKKSTITRLFSRAVERTHTPENEDEASFDKNLNQILSIFTKVPILHSYFTDSFNILMFARHITSFAKVESTVSSETSAKINLQQIEIIPPINFSQNIDGDSSPISFNVNELFLGSKSNHSYMQTCILCLDHLAARRKWFHAFDIASSQIFLPYCEMSWYKQIMDLILIGCINYTRRQREKHEEDPQQRRNASSEDAYKFILKLDNKELMGYIVLDITREWSDTKLCLDMLEFAYERQSEGKLKVDLTQMRDKIVIYHQIIESLNKPDINPNSNEESVKAGGYPDWKGWRKLQRETKLMPQVIIRHLSRKAEFDLARRWVLIHELPAELFFQIERDHILYLFTKDTEYTANVFMVLESFEPKDFCAKLCWNLLEILTKPAHILFIVQFCLQHLHHYLSSDEIQLLNQKQLGSKALFIIDEKLIPQYIPFIDDIILILEQLVMNMKLHLAQQVANLIKEEILKNNNNNNNINDNTNNNTVDNINTVYIQALTTSLNSLAFHYATLAITLLYTEEQQQPEIISVATPDRPSKLSIPKVESIPENIGSNLSPYKLHQPTPTQTSSTLPKTPIHLFSTSAPNTISNEFTETVLESGVTIGEQLFINSKAVNIQIAPSRANWCPDESAEKCQNCHVVYFSIINRRHHCRKCGQVVCKDCSPYKYHVDGYQGLVRICEKCHKTHYSKQFSPELIRMDSKTLRVQHKLQKSLSVSFGDSSDETKLGLFKPKESYQWQLDKDETKNKKLREEFFFEQAPNADLCIKLSLLHSDDKLIGEYLLGIAINLSNQLDSVIDSTEVDGLYVGTMMKNLLDNAKIILNSCDNNSAVAQCDLYLDRISLIQSLISIQDSEIHIPSLPKLINSDETRYLRETLLRYSHWQVALDISMKCQLDTNSVWVSWGISCLKAGCYEAAREKFKHCLSPLAKLPQQQQATAQPNASLVSRIIDQIENSIIPQSDSDNILQFFTKDTFSIEELINTKKHGDTTHMTTLQINEALFYLESYGSQKQMLDFLSKYKFIEKACSFVQTQNCTNEVFRESLLISSMKFGFWDELKKEMYTFDSNLRPWRHYLVDACEYFTNKNALHLTHELQNFLKDYVEAAKTCVLFYQHKREDQPCLTYMEFYERLFHLNEAIRLLKLAISETKSFKKNDPKPQVDIRAYLENIKLQIEVTEFMHINIKYAKKCQITINNQLEILTLFSNNALRAKLASNILLSGKDINAGLEMTVKIIKTYNLEVHGIFKDAAVQILSQPKINLENLRLLTQKCVEVFKISNEAKDQIILDAVNELPHNVLDCETILGLLVCDKNQININIQFGRLRNAYLVAIRSNNIEQVKRIKEIAIERNENSASDICERWLKQHK